MKKIMLLNCLYFFSFFLYAQKSPDFLNFLFLSPADSSLMICELNQAASFGEIFESKNCEYFINNFSLQSILNLRDSVYPNLPEGAALFFVILPNIERLRKDRRRLRKKIEVFSFYNYQDSLRINSFYLDDPFLWHPGKNYYFLIPKNNSLNF